ncbi:uncharacterized protein FFNC_15364 [Fusarium fujikuroi]|nr:uncharacterized protein FFNC_15364 [Fusarium fujikuroi]
MPYPRPFGLDSVKLEEDAAAARKTKTTNPAGFEILRQVTVMERRIHDTNSSNPTRPQSLLALSLAYRVGRTS